MVRPAADTIVIRQHLAALKTSVVTECLPGRITILTDPTGTLLPKYEAALRGRTEEQLCSVEYRGARWERDHAFFLGYGEGHEDPRKVREFLHAEGFDETSIEEILDQYDLRAVDYLSVRQLSETARRQLHLIRMLNQAAKPLVLNDPFLPFNGRWREEFAEMLLRFVEQCDYPIVVVNLSFLPKAWSESPKVQTVDLARESDLVIARQERILAQEQERVRKEAERIQRQRNEGVPTPPISSREPSPFDPDAAIRDVRREARMGAFIEGIGRLRANSGLIAALSVVVLVLSLGFTLYPIAQEGWPRVRAITSQQQWSWSDVWSALTSAPVAEIPSIDSLVVPQAVQRDPDLANLLEEESSRHEDSVGTESSRVVASHQTVVNEILLCVPVAKVPWFESSQASPLVSVDSSLVAD